MANGDDNGPNRRSDDHRIAELEKAHREFSGEVIGLSKEVGALGQQMDRIEGYISQVTNRPVNVAAWVTLAFVAIATIGGGAAFMVQYVESRQGPIAQDVEDLREFRKQAIDYRIEQAYANGRKAKAIEVLERDQIALEIRIDRLEGDL